MDSKSVREALKIAVLRLVRQLLYATSMRLLCIYFTLSLTALTTGCEGRSPDNNGECGNLTAFATWLGSNTYQVKSDIDTK